MLGSFSFLAIRKHVSMSQSTSAGSAAQPAPTKRLAPSFEVYVSVSVRPLLSVPMKSEIRDLKRAGLAKDGKLEMLC